MKPVETLRRMWTVHERHGVRGLLFATLARLGYRRLVLYRGDLLPHGPEPTPRNAARFSILERSDLPAWSAYRPQDALGRVVERLDAGQRCVVSWRGDRIVHSCWEATGRAPIPYLGVDLILCPDDVYVFDAWTAPPERGLGLSIERALWARGLRHEEGFRRMLSAIYPENAQALGTKRALGDRPIAVISVLGHRARRHVSVRRLGRSRGSRSRAVSEAGD